MDASIIFIGIISLALFIVPVVMLNINRRKKEKQTLDVLATFAKEKNCTISESETLGYLAIGIDKAAHVIFAMEKKKDQEIQPFAIALNDMKSCKIINTAKGGKSKEGDSVGIQKLELQFTPVAKDKTEVRILFYSALQSIQLSDELKTIEKWHAIVNEQLTKIKPEMTTV